MGKSNKTLYIAIGVVCLLGVGIVWSVIAAQSVVNPFTPTSSATTYSFLVVDRAGNVIDDAVVYIHYYELDEDHNYTAEETADIAALKNYDNGWLVKADHIDADGVDSMTPAANTNYRWVFNGTGFGTLMGIPSLGLNRIVVAYTPHAKALLVVGEATLSATYPVWGDVVADESDFIAGSAFLDTNHNLNDTNGYIPYHNYATGKDMWILVILTFNGTSINEEDAELTIPCGYVNEIVSGQSIIYYINYSFFADEMSFHFSLNEDDHLTDFELSSVTIGFGNVDSITTIATQ